MQRHSGTPRGTLGGATLPGAQQHINADEAPQGYVSVPHEDNSGIVHDHEQSHQDMSMAHHGSQRRPWNASSFGDGRGSGISELHDGTLMPVYEEEQSARRFLVEMDTEKVVCRADSGLPAVIPHVTVMGRPMSVQSDRSDAAEMEHTEPSRSRLHSPTHSAAPTPRHNSVPSSPTKSPSRQNSQSKTSMSARGSSGFISAEQAMAGGWTNKDPSGEDDDEDN